MKRILVLALALILAVSSLAVPSYAAEFDNDMWTNVLEYSTANGSGGNSFTSDTTGYVTYTMPAGTAVNYIDALVKIAGLVPSSVTISSGAGNNPRELSIIQCGNGLYRIYGNTGNRVTGVLRLNFTFPESSGNYITFLSLKVGVGDRYYEPTMGMMSGNVAEGSIRLIYDPDDSSIAGTSVIVDINDDITDYLLYLECSNWQNYDYIDYQIYFTEVASLNGITAVFGDLTLPVSVSYLGSNYDNAYYVSIRVDLTGIDRGSSKDYYPMVLISGTCNFDFNYFALMSVTGIYKFESLPWYLYLFQQWETVSTGFWNGITGIITGWQTSWTTWTASLSTMLTDSLAEINSRISGWRSAWNTFTQSVTTGISNIISLLDPDSNSNDFKDQVDDQGDRLDQMDEALNSVSKPALDRVDTNISGIVSNTDLVNTAHVYTCIIDDNIMAPALTLVTILAMMSFAFFGKR